MALGSEGTWEGLGFREIRLEIQYRLHYGDPYTVTLYFSKLVFVCVYVYKCIYE